MEEVKAVELMKINIPLHPQLTSSQWEKEVVVKRWLPLLTPSGHFLFGDYIQSW